MSRQGCLNVPVPSKHPSGIRHPRKGVSHPGSVFGRRPPVFKVPAVSPLSLVSHQRAMLHAHRQRRKCQDLQITGRLIKPLTAMFGPQLYKPGGNHSIHPGTTVNQPVPLRHFQRRRLHAGLGVTRAEATHPGSRVGKVSGSFRLLRRVGTRRISTISRAVCRWYRCSLHGVVIRDMFGNYHD